MEYEENIPLTTEEITKIKDILLTTPFESLEFHKYFFRRHLSDYSDSSRHGFSKEEVKKFYSNPLLISKGFKRKSEKGYHYTLCYNESETSYVKIVYLFDEVPVKILNAMRIFRNLDKAVKRKYGLRF